jgi:hypothetical protein
MTTRALMQFDALGVTLMLEDGRDAPYGKAHWEVHLRHKRDELQVWMEASEAAAVERFSEVETMLRVLEAIDSRRVH